MVPGRVVASDTETTGLHAWLGDRPFMFTFANERGDEKCIEFPVNPKTREVRYNAYPRTYAALKKWAADRSVRKVFFNAKFDVRMYEFAGIPVAGPIDDVMFMAKICRTDETTYGLKYLAKKYGDIGTEDQQSLHRAVASLRIKAKKLGYKIAEDADADYWILQHAEDILTESLRTMATWKKMKLPTQEKRLQEAVEAAKSVKSLCETYGTLDAARTIYLFLFYKEILADLGLEEIYAEEMTLWHYTYAMETRGVHINLEQARAGRAKALKQRETILQDLKSETWPEFNPASYTDKVELLIHQQNLEPLQETSNGNPSVDKYFLEYYEDECPLVKKIQDFGRADKAVGMYFDTYLASEVAELIHASFDQVGAKTLRFSCRDPNFQFVPKRAPEGDIMLEVRRPLGPRPGHVWYMMDYSQIEARIFADKANEETMIASFMAGRDVYNDLTERIVELTGTTITRRDTKDIFLGKLYGLGKKKMIRKLMASGVEGATEETALEVISAFDTTFPTVRACQQEVIAMARKDGYVTNRYGQRIDADPDAPYKSVNHLIQSEAARLMKRAMIRCGRYLREIGYGWLVMTIHDELVFEFAKLLRPVRVLKTLQRIMEDNEGRFCVPTPVEVKKTVASWLNKQDCSWSTAN